MASTDFLGSSLYHTMGQPYYPQAAGSVKFVEGHGREPMPQGRSTARGTSPVLLPLSQCCPCHLLCSPWKPCLGQRTASSPPRLTEMKPPSHTPPSAVSALTRWTFSLLTRSGSGVTSLFFLSRITGVPKTFRCRKKRGLLASA